jgi:serine/threonine-protein kinase
MSRVFVATETALGRKIVIKVLSHELAGGLSGERFHREIQLAASLQHPNIVPLLNAGETLGVPYYTMPLVEGESVRAKLQRAGELPVREAVAILRDVARALEYAHAHGVVHRDIKPDNVLLSSDYAVVTDFGVAKALIAARTGAETITQLGVAIGTPAYMSPEQTAGDQIDHRADIYAFGCMAYEMLTGATPFRDTSAPALFAAHATRTPMAITEIRPAIPTPLATLVMRCLQKRPSDRPQSAREIIDALDAVTTPTVDTLQTLTTPAPRSRVRLGALAVVIAAIIAAVAFTLLRPARATLNDSVVAVTPFRVAGADPSLRMLREGMLDLVAAKLAGSIRAVDARTLLNSWRNMGGSETNDLPNDRALTLSANLGAGRLLQGEIVGTPEHVVINASLAATRNGETRATASVTGAQSQLALLVDSLVAELLVRESGGSEKQARQLAGIPFPALQAYLAGQSLYRRGRYKEAEKQFMRALDVDSTFVLAGLQLHLTSLWTVSGLSSRGLPVALRAYDQLGPRERLTLNGLDPRWLQGYRVTCAEHYDAAEHGVAQMPELPESWYVLGDILVHCGWVMAGPNEDPWRRAIAIFERGLAVDSTFVPLREHLPLLYAYAGDSAKMKVQLDAMRRDSADYVEVNHFWLGLMPDSIQRRRYVDREVAGRTAGFLSYVAIISGEYVDDADYALRQMQRTAATHSERAQLAAIERRLALNRGQPSRAAAAAHIAAVPTSEIILDAVFWDGDSSAAAKALTDASRAFGRIPPTDSLREWADRVFAVAQYELAQRDTTHARRAIALLQSVTAPLDRRWLIDRPRQLALLLDVQLAAQTKRPDATALLERADSLLRLGPSSLVLATGSLIVTRLWEEKGDRARAYSTVKRMYIGPTSAPYYSTYRLERGRIAAALGQTGDALEQYRVWLAYRSAAEAPLRPQVAAVRKEFERLQQNAR